MRENSVQLLFSGTSTCLLCASSTLLECTGEELSDMIVYVCAQWLGLDGA
jgi:hypothetical protein